MSNPPPLPEGSVSQQSHVLKGARPAEQENPRRVELSPLRRLWGWVPFAAVIVGSMCLGLAASSALRGQDAPSGAVPVLAISILFAAFSVLGLLIGAALYGIVIATNCLTFDFTRPFLSTYGRKRWVTNIVVGLFIQAGLACAVGAVLVIPLSMVLSSDAAFLTAFFVPFVAAQVLFAWLNIVTPLEKRLTTARLVARGISRESIATGRFIGTSDPAKNSHKKFTIVEEDMGVLWIGDGQLVFYGDRQDWTIRHDQLLAVERVADSGAMSAYFGAVHVILRSRRDDGSEWRMRLHPEGIWTGTGKARELDAIAARLEAWQSNPIPGWPEPHGFEVSGAGAQQPAAGTEQR